MNACMTQKCTELDWFDTSAAAVVAVDAVARSITLADTVFVASSGGAARHRPRPHRTIPLLA